MTATGLITIPRKPNGQLVQNAVRVEVLGPLGIITQRVILSSCYIN